MEVEILYFAEFKDITQKDKENLNIDKAELSEVIEGLFKKYNSLKNLIWDESSDDLKSNISIAVNGEMTNVKDKLTTPLSDGDKIAFLLPLSGG